jgi:hypothetical protein
VTFFKEKVLVMETKIVKGLLMKQGEKEDKPRTIEPVHKNKLAASAPIKRSATAAGVGIKPSFLDGLLNDGIMPEPLEVKQSKVTMKVEEVKTNSEEEKEGDKDGNKISGSGMTMLLAGIKYEG